MNNADADKLASMTVTDSKDDVTNAAFYAHADTKYIYLSPNNRLKSDNVPIEFFYQTSAGSTWHQVRVADTTATIAHALGFAIQTTGSKNFEQHTNGPMITVNLPVGEYLTGYRVVLSPDDATSLTSGAELSIAHQFVASTTPLPQGETLQPAPGIARTVNTVTGTGATTPGNVALRAEDDVRINIYDRANITAGCPLPTTSPLAEPVPMKRLSAIWTPLTAATRIQC